MYPFPIEKYKFFVHDIKTDEGIVKEVVAISTYAGKRVRASAKCAPGDTFDLEKGKELAATRCALKIAKKRYKRALHKYYEANDMVRDSKRYLRSMEQYYSDAIGHLDRIEQELKDIEAEI